MQRIDVALNSRTASILGRGQGTYAASIVGCKWLHLQILPDVNYSDVLPWEMRQTMHMSN